MTSTNPVAEVRAAAERLRTLGSAATPGPWTIAEVWPYTDPLLMSQYEETPQDGDVLIAGNVDVEPADAAYIAALHPGLAGPLARLLDLAASGAVDDDHEHHQDAGVCTPETCDMLAALEVARLLNHQPELTYG